MLKTFFEVNCKMRPCRKCFPKDFVTYIRFLLKLFLYRAFALWQVAFNSFSSAYKQLDIPSLNLSFLFWRRFHKNFLWFQPSYWFYYYFQLLTNSLIVDEALNFLMAHERELQRLSIQFMKKFQKIFKKVGEGSKAFFFWNIVMIWDLSIWIFLMT